MILSNSKIIYLLVNSARLALSLVNLLLWFCVVDTELEDSWNNLREILDERWLGDLSHKFPEEILRLYIFRNMDSKQQVSLLISCSESLKGPFDSLLHVVPFLF